MRNKYRGAHKYLARPGKKQANYEDRRPTRCQVQLSGVQKNLLSPREIATRLPSRHARTLVTILCLFNKYGSR